MTIAWGNKDKNNNYNFKEFRLYMRLQSICNSESSKEFTDNGPV